MSVLVVGLSHKSAPLPVLERLTVDTDGWSKLVHDLLESEHVSEAVVVSTCNRVEVYVEVDRFHGSVEDVSGLLAERAGGVRADVVPFLYVHYDDAAVAHLFAVVSGLDSMVVGESQIIGQVRNALARGQQQSSVGPALNTLFQQALRVGKRGHAETGIDMAGPSIVAAALDHVEAISGPLAPRRVLVVGAGAMASLVVSTLSRRGARDVVVINRTPERAERLAATVGGRAAAWADLGAELAKSDLLISGTGATGVVVDRATVATAADRPDRPLVLLDLAVPHDVAPEAAALPGVRLLSLRELAQVLADPDVTADVTEVRRIVAEEVSAFLGAVASARVTPTVVALRSMATDVVDGELNRLDSRLPNLDPAVRAELAQAVRRVADKLLHAPTVRIKELTGEVGALSYADALADLFSLDPATVDAVTRVDVTDAVTRVDVTDPVTRVDVTDPVPPPGVGPR